MNATLEVPITRWLVSGGEDVHQKKTVSDRIALWEREHAPLAYSRELLRRSKFYPTRDHPGSIG